MNEQKSWCKATKERFQSRNGGSVVLELGLGTVGKRRIHTRHRYLALVEGL